MKLLRLLAVVAVAGFVLRRLVRSVRAQALAMSHPVGTFGAPQGSGRGWLRADPEAVGGYSDATDALSRSWVDERTFAQPPAPAGGEPVVANASEAGIVQSVEFDGLRLEHDPRDEA